MKGRFAQILPTKVLDAATCELAKTLLKNEAISACAVSRQTFPYPRSRR